MSPSSPKDIATSGKKVGSIPVHISYRIIKLFSGHLYSNPAKAIEELVVNAYDAFAQKCHIILPEDWEAEGARVVVWDDGESMDQSGLNELWLVADSYKRSPDREQEAEQKGRLPVGKFGIGKLASYVIGERISHICRREGRILAVTVDFSEIIPEEAAPLTTSIEPPKQIHLSVRELTIQQAIELFGSLDTNDSQGNGISLFGPDASSSWTLVIVDGLKEEAKHIRKGRLRWIISTALPLVPDFSVYLDGERVPPSKEDINVLRTWVIGEDDKVAKNRGYDVGSDEGEESPFDHWIMVPGIGRVSGELSLYEDTLVRGKSVEVGRSHGFFIMIRRRLINHDDPLFGTHTLSHMTFNRLRAVVHVNGLDEHLVASREDVADDPKVDLQDYLNKKFYEIRQWYEKVYCEKTMRKERGIQDRLATLPGSLAQFPLRHAIERYVHDKNAVPSTIRMPAEGEEVVNSVKGFEIELLSPTEPLAVFDASSGIVRLNASHPFYLNYEESEALEEFATTEILLEAYLNETSLPQDEIRRLLRKRDKLLRALVKERPLSVTTIADGIRDSVHSDKELEKACHRGFEALGFEVAPMGASGQPEGLASAILGMKSDGGVEEPSARTYTLTYDAKSTKYDRVKSGNLNLSSVRRHRRKYGADYAVVIAPDFQTTHGDESMAVEEAKQEGICLLRASDFADLVELSGAKPLPLNKLESLFKECRSPENSHDWVSRFRDARPDLPDIRLLLDTIYEIQQEDLHDPPSIGAIKYKQPRLENVPGQTIRELVRSLSRLVPDLIHLDGEDVELNNTPEHVVRHVEQALKRIERRIGRLNGKPKT